MEYPDLSQPLAESSEYPDLSQPTAAQYLESQAAQQGAPKNTDQWRGIPRSPARSLIEMNQAMHSPKTAAQYGISALGNIAMLAVPELRMMAGEGLMPGAANMLGRTVAGTGATTAGQAENINSMEDLKRISKQNFGLNALLEAGTIPFRGASTLSELTNPLKYTENKAQQIRNEYQAVKTLQNETYQPVMNKYGSYNVTLTPEKYLTDMGIKEKGLYSEAKELYRTFKNEPTFQNLHNLQSKIGSDLRAAQAAKKPASVSRFKTYKNKLNEKVDNYLSHDPEMKKQYELGSEITRNQVAPYEANKNLEKIIYGTKEFHTPESLSSAIRQGTEKIVSKKGIEAFPAIPEGHALRNHLRDLNRKMNIGELTSHAIPTGLGILSGELLYPGLGGGLAGGLAGAGLKHFAGKGGKTLLSQAQNPAAVNFIRALSKPYHAGGRTLMDYQNK